MLYQHYSRYSHMQLVMQSNNNAIYGMWCIGTDHGWMEVDVQMVHSDLLVNSLHLLRKKEMLDMNLSRRNK